MIFYSRITGIVFSITVGWCFFVGASVSHSQTTKQEKAGVPFRHDSSLYWLAFSPDGSRLASMGKSDGIRIWDLNKKKQLHNIPIELPFSEIAFGGNAKTLVFGDLDGLFVFEEGSKPELIAEARFVPVGDSAFSVSNASLRVSKDGKHILAADSHCELKLIDSKSKKSQIIQQGNDNKAATFYRLARFSPDNTLIAFTLKSGEISVWNIADRKVVSTLQGHKATIHSLEFSHDGALICSGSQDETFRIWNCKEGKQVAVLGDQDTVCIGCFSIKNRNAAIVADGKGVIRIWDFARKKVLHEVEGPASGFMSLAIHPSGDYFVTAGEDHAIGFWNAETGSPIKK